MSTPSRRPVVFLACVNSYQNGKRLRYLVHERKGIARLLAPLSKKAHYRAVQKGNLSHTYFFDLLQENQYHDRIHVLHFVGHADIDHLRVESDQFEVTIHRDELSKLIASLPNLQAVFLSGCATQGLIDMLIRRDIPAILATRTTEKNSRTTQLAKTFYRALAQGCNLREAFEATQHQFPEFEAHSLKYLLEEDEILWNEAMYYGKIPWGMYYLEDNAYRLTQKPARQTLLDLPMRRGWRFFKYATAGLLIGLLATGLTWLLREPEYLSLIMAF